MKSVQPDIQTIDAMGQTPGRLASRIVTVLMGKNRAGYEPHIDSSNHVQVINASKMRITGRKIEQKNYYHHTTRGSGLRVTSLKSLWMKDPSDVLRRAVSRMLPKNKLRTERMKRLVVKN
ncbi:50S ribosomal protein L13 [Candidatus Uhrbacteria bacterium]|nr:50S ribosomal protein L13 [Candidatus Uhrbacteria bacterium]